MIDKKKIQKGLDKAYKEVGHNAYFGNGFEKGVEFTLEEIKNNPNFVAKVEKEELRKFLNWYVKDEALRDEPERITSIVERYIRGY